MSQDREKQVSKQQIILNVDDNEIGRYTKTRFLELAGYQVLECGTGTRALEIATTQLPDLVLLDVKLPDVDGFEVCRRLKSDARTRTIPVLQVSATFIGDHFKVLGLEGGADGYLTPPLEQPVLAATVRALLRARAAEQDLRASELYYRQMLESLPQLVWTCRPNGNVDFVSNQWLHYTGLEAEELLGAGWLNALHADDRDGALALWHSSVASLCPYETEYRIRAADGVYRWFQARGRPIHGTEGEITRWFGTCTDIDARKRSQEELRTRNESLRLLAETATRLLVEPQASQILRDVFGRVAAHVGAEAFLNHLVLEDSRFLQLDSSSGLTADEEERVQSLRFGEGISGRAAQDRRRIVLENIQATAEPLADTVRGLGFDAYACHPLVARNRLIGTVSFATRKRPRFTAQELDIMRTVADQAAMAVERARLTSELQERAKELVAANRAKDDFLAVLSHEMRTPLNSISLWAQYLREIRPEDDELGKGLSDVEASVKVQTRLIEDLLDISRIISGKLEVQHQLLRLPEVIDAAVATVASAAQSGRVAIITDLEPVSRPVVGDAARLQQVVWNLLTNAVRFTPAGGQIDVRLREVNSHAVITVSDTGEGIEPSMLPHVFNRFWQADSSTKRKHAGLGLGLAIVRHLVELHRGTVHAHSPGHGHGATFTITLPLAAAADLVGTGPSPLPETLEDSGRLVRLEGLRILVVEDQVSSGDMLQRVLQRTGAEVRLARSVAEGMVELRAAPFDVLISDIAMPDRDGYEFIAEVRSSDEAFRSLPALALTALAREEDRRRAIAAGFDDVLTKPVQPARILKFLQTIAGEV